MSRSGFSINFLIKRNRYLWSHKHSPYVLFQERYFSTSNDNDGEDQKQKSPAEMRTTNTNNTEVKESSPSSKIVDPADKKAAAKKKLFSLLSDFKVEPSNESKVNLNLARAVKRISKEERFKDMKILSPREKLQVAVKNVSENIKGDPDQTQLELNTKLSSLNLIEYPKTEEAAAAEVKIEVDEEMKKNIMSSVKDIATTVTDIKATTAIRSKLTQRLLELAVSDTSSSLPNKSIDSVLKGMKIEQGGPMKRGRETTHKTESHTRTMYRPSPLTTINIFQSPPLDIFSVSESPKIDLKKTVWNCLEEKNLKLLVQFAPVNGFEEMILWTEQGKHWTFPIDNEIDMGAEENVGFNEHVFLEQHLHGFPTKGAVRQFMELVTVGLSQNPYITVERKIENIDWFRNYFKEKEEILKHHGALG